MYIVEIAGRRFTLSGTELIKALFKNPFIQVVAVLPDRSIN